MMTDLSRLVTCGVDTHKDFHAAVMIDAATRPLADAEFPADLQGYTDLLEWASGFGTLEKVGVEGTGSYGKGLARFLTGQGVRVVEVIRPDRQARRRNGKSDKADAEAAAVTALSGRHSGTPKSGEGPIEALRVLRIARGSAVAQSTALINQIGAILMTAPESVIDRYHNKRGASLYQALVRARPGPDATDPATATIHALQALARRREFLQSQIGDLDIQMGTVVSIAAPRLLARFGVGPQTAATLLICAGDNPDRLRSAGSFTALCGSSPVDASSGKRQGRHKLNRAGDRQANSALWRIALCRMQHDPRTQVYVTRRTAEGLTKPEIIRCLKTYIARELYPVILADLAEL